MSVVTMSAVTRPIIQSAKIVDYETASPSFFSFAVFVVEVKVETSNVHHVVRHRFSDFYSLHTKLQAKYPTIELPTLYKQTFGNMDEQFISGRLYTLNSFLKKIVESQELSSDHLVYSFLAPHLLSVDKPSFLDEIVVKVKRVFGRETENQFVQRTVNSSLDLSKDVLTSCIVTCLFNFLSYLELDDLLSLVRVNHAYFSHCSPFISENFYFSQEIDTYHNKVCNFYNPKRVIDSNGLAVGSKKGVTHLHLAGAAFAKPPNITSLPSSITHLTFGDSFFQTLPPLPPFLTHLTFSTGFNIKDPELGSILPPSLTHLILSDSYSHEILSLPNNLLHVKFGVWYAHDFSPILPPTLTSLTFGGQKFSSPFSKPLPSSITHLTFSDYSNYDHIGTYSFPSSTTHLILPIFFASNFVAPPSLQFLKVNDISNCNVGFLPSSLTELDVNKLGHQYTSLPSSLRVLNTSSGEPIPPNLPSLTQLTLGYSFNSPLVNLPSSLTKLVVGEMFNHPVSSLPPSLTYLSLNKSFNHPLDALPPSLIVLFSGQSFNHPVVSLPHSLRELTLGHTFSFPVDSLPPSLTQLSIGDSFNHPINCLPSKLTHLVLGHTFNHPVDSLPTSLSYLVLGNAFNLSVDSLPSSLSFLALGKIFNQTVDHLPQHLSMLLFLGSVFDQSLANLPCSIRQITTYAYKYPMIPRQLNHVKHKVWF